MKQDHSCTHDNHSHQLNLKRNKTGRVLIISILAMLLEIFFGYLTNSMALLSDGWHMASHVVAIGAGWLAYQYVVRQQKRGKTVNVDKTLSYVGFFNAIALAAIAITILFQSIERLSHPEIIQYNEAILVAIIGLIVNIVSARILHHDEAHSDHNLKATYLHVLADILTSALALLALLAGRYFYMQKADVYVGILGSLIILYWARGIIFHSGKAIFRKPSNDNN